MRMVLHGSASPMLKESVDSLGYHAEPVGSARLAEHGRASLLFLSPPNILHLNLRPRTRARSLLLKCNSLLISCSVTHDLTGLIG
jgi:hypothetical protein